MKSRKIAIKGSYLPDIGGISIHVSRLAEALYKDGLLDCVFSNTNPGGYIEPRFIVKSAYYPRVRYGILQSLLWVLRYGIRRHYSIIHMHGHPVWESLTIHLLILSGKRIVFTIHDQMMLNDLKKYPGILLFMFKNALKNKNAYWIAVNSRIKMQVEGLCSDIRNLSVIPAYLPDINNETPLDPEIENFINSRSKILSVYAHSVRELDGKDLYGIDLALRSLVFVKKYFHDTGIIICIPNTPDSNKLENYYKIINENNLSNNVLFFLKPLTNPIMLWQRSDAVLRPTLSDGDSLIIREALSQGTYVIASDIVKRPANVILFKTGDIEDLSSKIIEILSKDRMEVSKCHESNYDLIKKIYANLLS